ncbi:hypothetical protein A9495_00995 [Brachyspira hampsonii]|uniref:hypothetical protein n=1 Tax=Brachyspira hampsonii TaxID=1287055 RepID=UPI000304DE88|nr:hypothetical protein [Brachyspira hampsonii]MBW5394027.1 hypothetical protein [Brachyspira hampsonii]OEJ15100.1 hypothetical protein A9495_00995 [Brachyspira hampsonii]
MKKSLIILLSVCLFIYGCNYKALNPVSTDTSNENTENSDETSGIGENNNTQIVKKTMNFKLKVEGSSSSKYFVKNGTMYASIIEINLNNKTCTYNADLNGGYYMCNNNDWGRTMTTGKYIKLDNMYFEYNEGSEKFNLDFYLWIGAQFSNLILRKDIIIEIPLNNFDEEKYNNTALITLKLLPDSDTYTFTLDGFETK